MKLDNAFARQLAEMYKATNLETADAPTAPGFAAFLKRAVESAPTDDVFAQELKTILGLE